MKMDASNIYMSLMFILFCGIRAHPTGAPKSACSTMTPGHGETPQPLEESPFNVTTTVSGRTVTGEHFFIGWLSFSVPTFLIVSL